MSGGAASALRDARDMQDPAAGQAVHERPQQGPYTLLDLKSTPVPFRLTWARQAVLPCKLGARKDVTLLDVVRCKGKVDLLLPSGRVVYGFSVRDTILNGRFSVNVPARVVTYEKRLSLPNGANLSASAGFQHVGGGPLGAPWRRQFKPILGAQLRFGSVGDGNIVFNGDSFSLKQRLPLPLRRLGLRYPRFELETFTSVRIPQLTSRYSVHGDGLTLGEPLTGGAGRQQREDDALHVHVQAINVVARL